MTPRVWFGFAASLLAALAPIFSIATVLVRRVEIDVLPDGTVRERNLLTVRLDNEEELEQWATYPIFLNENRTLEQVEAYAVRPDGKRFKVGREHQDTRETSGQGILHQSGYAQTIEFPGAAVGWRLKVDYQVLIQPYYPSGSVVLTSDEPVESLAVEVRGRGEGWRWRLDGPAPGIEIEETASGLRLRGRDLPATDPPAQSPRGAAIQPVLRYAWGDDASWSGVGRWYREVLSTVPRGAEPVRQQARDLVVGITDPRQRLERLLTFLRQKVRYVAVEIGIGGYRPTPPIEVLERKWGDCKDKALLLIDLLDEVGIEAYPALILAAQDRRIDIEFPSLQFNHLIVAVPAAAVAHSADEPIAADFLFVDPTQTRGSARWLQPADQDQHAVVVQADSAQVVRTAIRQQWERRTLKVDVEVSPAGDAVGKVRLRLSGQQAARWLEQIATTRLERIAEAVLAVLNRLLPGVTIEKVGWRPIPGGVPALEMGGDVVFGGLVAGRGGRHSMQLPGLRSAPEPRLTTDRDVAIVLEPTLSESTWTIRLPEGWCLPEAKEQTVETEVGVFRQSLEPDPGGGIVVRRETELRQRWIEPEDFPALEELALAEYRAHRRRIRLECKEAKESDPFSSR